MQTYSDPKRASSPTSLPDVEVFFVRRPNGLDGLAYIGEMIVDDSQTEEPLTEGWYYWYCLPGCLPDSEPMGPFDTRDEAIADAQQDADDDEDEADA
jgi:hypothetical protein